MPSGGVGTPLRRGYALLVVAAIIQCSYAANFNLERWKRQSCRNHQFQCKSGMCIDFLHLCDGTKHCDDGTDETEAECSSYKCPSYAYQCDYGACIDKVGVCNGVAQCADNSDEKEEKCGTTTRIPTHTTASPSGSCKLPPQPANGQYKLRGCNPPACQPVPGNSVPSSSYMLYTCHSDFQLSGSPFLVCEGEWSAKFPTCSQVSCPALGNPSREFECFLNDKSANHNAPMAPGTRCTATCSHFYTSIQEFENLDTHCQPNGSWSRFVPPCAPRCGEPNPHGVVYVSGGTEAKYGEFPWHVGIYRMLQGSYQQVCGASIISERFIVSAAHCFWDTTTGTQINNGEYRIAVGKFYRDWERNNERYIQLPEIQSILLHHRFKGDEINWQNDIALIKVKDSIRMTVVVQPICMDYNKEQDRLFTPGKPGVVIGWGITENETQSDTLRTTSLPYVSFETCFKKVPSTFRPFLTPDKFCAGYQNGTSVCQGDSGGGYGVQFLDGKWYLVGLVSVGVPVSNSEACNTYEYTTFAKVSEFHDFIRRNLL